jgi:hypothetical protein
VRGICRKIGSKASPGQKLKILSPKECKLGYNKDICTPIFIAALFTITKLWKHQRCPTTDEWIKKMYLYTMKCYSDIKKNEILSFEDKWLELKNII